MKTMNKHAQFLKVQDNNRHILNKMRPYCFYNQLNIRIIWKLAQK